MRKFGLALLLILVTWAPAQAAISLVSSTKASGSSAAPTVTAPGSTAYGDRLYVIIAHNVETVTCADNNGANPTTEALDANGGSSGVCVYSRLLTNSEPASWVYTLSSAQRWAMVAFVVRNSSPSDPFDVDPANGIYGPEPTDVTVPGITIGVAKAWAIGAAWIDGTPDGSWTAVPSGFTEIQTETGQQPLSVAYRQYDSTGATGDVVFTKTSGGGNQVGSIALFSIIPVDWGYILTEGSDCINAENSDRLITEDVTAGVGPCDTPAAGTPLRSLLGVGF